MQLQFDHRISQADARRDQRSWDHLDSPFSGYMLLVRNSVNRLIFLHDLVNLSLSATTRGDHAASAKPALQGGSDMANTESGQGRAPSATEPANVSLGIPRLPGVFAYRFSGYAMTQTRPFYLTGLGQFQIDAKGNLTGAHRAANMAIQGQDAKVRLGAYDLKGTIN